MNATEGFCIDYSFFSVDPYIHLMGTKVWNVIMTEIYNNSHDNNIISIMMTTMMMMMIK